MQSGMVVGPTCFNFSIFVIRLCRAILTSGDAYVYLCCCGFDEIDSEWSLEGVVAAGIFQLFHGPFPDFGCVHNVCNVFSFPCEEMIWFCGRCRKSLFFA